MDGSQDYGYGPEIGRPDKCALDLKKYFFVIGVVSVLILIGTYWYTQFHSQGTDIASGGSAKDPAAAVKSAVNWFPRQFGGGNPVARAPVAAPDNRLMGAPPGGRTMTAAPANQPMARPNFLLAKARPGGGVAMAGPNFLLAKGTFPDIVRAMHDSVVNITATRARRGQLAPTKAADQAQGNGVFFTNPFSGRTVDNIGSGVIIRSDGYILTNFHIVRGTNAVNINVFEGRVTVRYRATVQKMDETLDLALLKIEPKRPLSAAILGNSDELRVADNVIAIGSPFGLDQTVSRGIVSALRKSLVIEGVNHANLIQTDTPINQGNSGGPLIAENGTVIGINTAIYTPTGAFAGISFAIPSNVARQFVESQLTSIAGAAIGGRALPMAMQARGGTAGANAVAVGGLRFAGPPSGLAMNVAAAGGAAPTIVAGTPAPHKDGRENLDCLSCHKIVATSTAHPVAFTPAIGTMATGLAMNVAAPLPRDPGPAINANDGTPGNHRDGRDRMNCAFCHQIRGAASANPVAFGIQPGNTLATGLAMNVAAPLPRDPGPAINANDGTPGNHRDGCDRMNCAFCHQIRGAAGVNPVAFGTQPKNSFPGMPTNIAAPAPAAIPGRAGIGEVTLGPALMRIDGALSDRINHPHRKGVFVSKVKPHSLAVAAGLKAGDIILKVDGRRMRGPNQLVAALADRENGETARISVLRGDRRVKLIMIVAGLANMSGLPPTPGLSPNTGLAAAAGPQAGDKPPRRLPKDFKWKGLEVENFIQIPARGARGGKPRMGAKINEVKRGSPADKAGIRDNDVLLEINGRLAGNRRLLDKAIRRSKGQNNYLLKLMRGPQEFFTLLQ